MQGVRAMAFFHGRTWQHEWRLSEWYQDNSALCREINSADEIVKYQINDWDTHFENDRSRQREKCSFVCVPNKQHGMGFARIIAEPDGAAIYGIWCLILGACSQQKKRDGWLTDNGESKGSPWGAEDLSLKFRRPKEEIQRALDFISSERVGWIQIYNDEKSPSTHRAVTSKSPPTDPERNERTNETKETKGTEEKRNEANITRASLDAEMTPAGREALRLVSLCKELLGAEEMTRHHKRWTDRALHDAGKLDRVLAEVKVMQAEGRIKTNPARAAEDLWKRFK